MKRAIQSNIYLGGGDFYLTAGRKRGTGVSSSVMTYSHGLGKFSEQSLVQFVMPGSSLNNQYLHNMAAVSLWLGLF